MLLLLLAPGLELSKCTPRCTHASFDMTPLSAMWGISAAIQGANPRHMAWPIPKRGLHVNGRVSAMTRFLDVLLGDVFT